VFGASIKNKKIALIEKVVLSLETRFSEITKSKRNK
jgi:hypothetical protein